MMTWKDFKTAVEAAGVRDEDEVVFIDCDHAPIVTFEPDPDLQPGEPRVSREPREPRAFHVS